MSGVYVVLEEREGRIARIGWEALAAAQLLGRQLSQPVTAVVLGAATESQAAEAASKSPDKVVRVEHPLLAHYTADGFIAALQQLIHTESPAIVIFPHTYQIRDFAPALAARLGQVLISDVVSIAEGPPLHPPAHAGPSHRHLPAHWFGPMLHLRPGRSLPCGRRSNWLRRKSPPSSPPSIPRRSAPLPASPSAPPPQTVDLGSAQMIVSVGRGIKEESNLPIVQDLAASLGAELAASRPICDNGWLPMERQVGSSGQTVAPKLYPRRWHLRGHPAPRRYERLPVHRRHQQGSRGPYLRSCRLRHSRRPL